MDSTKLLVRKILEKAHEYDWSLQGFGMFRLYLSDEIRLHLWDNTYSVKDCTTVHDHPWHFDSLVVAGTMCNSRYTQAVDEAPDDISCIREFDMITIKCGEGAHTVGNTERIRMFCHRPELIAEGNTYRQTADEVHSTFAKDGTITVVTRIMTDKYRDLAKVYCDPRRGFISAAPRAATFEEISGAARRSLERWF